MQIHLTAHTFQIHRMAALHCGYVRMDCFKRRRANEEERIETSE